MKINPATLDRKTSHDIMVGAALPRPIAFISTLGANGIYNLAPYSFFIPMAAKPAIVGWASVGRGMEARRIPW